MSALASDGGRLRVYLLGNGEETAAVREELLGLEELELVGSAASAHEAAAELAAWDVDAILLATAGPRLPHAALDTVRGTTDAPIVVLAPADSPQVLEDAFVADAAEALLLPQPREALLFAVRKAAGRRSPAATETAAPARGGRVVTVFSPKGGTGKTAVSTNLAVAAASVHGRRTLLVDLDLQFGDCATVLGLEPKWTIHDLVTAPGELDPDKLAGYLSSHASGVDLISAPAQPEEAELIPVGRVVRLLEVAREAYELVVVDTAPFLHGPTLAALDNCDELLLVASLDLPTLKDVRQSLRTLELIQFPHERLSLLLNRATADVGIKPAEVEVALGRQFRYALPEDRGVQVAVNRARPVIEADPGAPFAMAAVDLAARVLGGPVRAPEPAAEAVAS